MDNSQYIKDNYEQKMSLSVLSKELVFGENSNIFIAFKKTEKLSSAVFLVTQHIPTEEHLRQVLRDKSVRLLSALSALRSSFQDEQQQNAGASGEVHGLIFEIVSLLSIARTVRYLSTMNADILQKEYCSLAHLLTAERGEERKREASEPELKSDFFDVPDSPKVSTKGHFKEPHERQKKEMSFRSAENEPLQDETRDAPQRTTEKRRKRRSAGVLVRHGRRRESILTLLKDKPNLSVKDVARTIPNVSEKTLQRELLKMVSEGILQKRGERRWSTYSLA